MNSLKLWIVLLALVAFLCGLGTGLYVAEREARAAALDQEFGEFERKFVAAFELDTRHQRLLAGFLDHYNREAQEIKDHYAAQNHQEMEPKLRRLGLEYRAILRDRLLSASQRPKFDRLMASQVENL